MVKHILVADIGGTHARFSLGQVGDVTPLTSPPHVFSCDAFTSFESLCDAAFHTMVGDRPVEVVVVAAAGPEEGRAIALTNRSWRVQEAFLQDRFGVTQCRVLNDFGAVAHCIANALPSHVNAIGGGSAQDMATRVVLGPGTGLGVAAITFGEHGRYHVVSGEGGNVTFAPTDDVEYALAKALYERTGRAFAEQVVSGDGLRRIHAWLHEGTIDLSSVPPASEIGQAALSGDRRAVESVHQMFACLGTIAGDLALTFGAKGGVFLTGGVVERLRSLVGQSPFRSRFEAKGRHRGYVSAIATRVVTASYPGLRGAWHVAEAMLPTSRPSGQPS